eukprot:11204733-Lingulodinium_polyedra.AAC.1
MSGTVYNRHMLKVAESLQAVYDLLYNSDVFLDEARLASLDRHCTRLGQNYQMCSVLASNVGRT